MGVKEAYKRMINEFDIQVGIYEKSNDYREKINAYNNELGIYRCLVILTEECPEVLEEE